jgi:hypothetical protein
MIVFSVATTSMLQKSSQPISWAFDVLPQSPYGRVPISPLEIESSSMKYDAGPVTFPCGSLNTNKEASCC